MYYNNRWNPTKEQIDMLEGFYKGGITCPSTAEIHHMAGKLRVYGNVESKNVFYWFQNHKARKRQRQVRHAYGYDPRLHYNHQQLLHQQIPSPMGLAPNPSAPCTNGIPVFLLQSLVVCPFFSFLFFILGKTSNKYRFSNKYPILCTSRPKFMSSLCTTISES
ncbi:hypothetical protein MKW94_004115 [Papaver nudicaule]|uniref:Homeobox domain-containing protein n=1 Tax=Papaver nudicaule TaxID=74823 RepID=A0AA41VJ55_PAPNU|nr:hypothetical protein [Papaver nudicaule]